MIRTDPSTRTRIRVWLLKRIAGDRAVVMNAHVDGTVYPLSNSGATFINVRYGARAGERGA